MKPLLILTILVLATTGLFAEEREPRIKSPAISAEKSPEAIAKAKKTGAATAKRDIADGKPAILYFGTPWSQGKPLVDDETGLPIEIVGGCLVSTSFVEEVGAYNATIREWHAEKTAGDEKAK